MVDRREVKKQIKKCLSNTGWNMECNNNNNNNKTGEKKMNGQIRLR